jgi:hypothetical protein
MRLWRNLKALGLITAGAPWLVACLILAWRGRAVPGPWKWCASALLLAVALQQLFWLTFKYYSWSPLRYEMPLLMVAAVGLPALACAVSQRWPRRGMVYVTLVLMLAGVASFLGGNHDFHPPLVNDQEDPMYPGQVTIGTWYARRAPFHLGRDYMLHADGIEVGFVYPLTPVGPAQLTILSTLLTLAALLIRRSYALAAVHPEPGPPGRADRCYLTAVRTSRWVTGTTAWTAAVRSACSCSMPRSARWVQVAFSAGRRSMYWERLWM